MSTLYKTVLFSGKFDPCHCGHVATIIRLSKIFHKVLIVILDYPEQRFPIAYRLQVMREILSACKGNYKVISNKIHFGKITKRELRHYDFDVYAAGNLSVLSHMENLGYKVIYTDRAYEYSARLISASS